MATFWQHIPEDISTEDYIVELEAALVQYENELSSLEMKSHNMEVSIADMLDYLPPDYIPINQRKK